MERELLELGTQWISILAYILKMPLENEFLDLNYVSIGDCEKKQSTTVGKMRVKRSCII